MARRGHHTLEEIKNMVLATAEDLVVQGGLPLLTARRIATKINYTVGSIYMVFGRRIYQVCQPTFQPLVHGF
jgi:AcrR family transcriptional regulator